MATYQTDDGEWTIGDNGPKPSSKGLVILLLKEEVVAYRPLLAKACGGACAALFLSQMIHWSGKGKQPDGWIWKTQREMEDETGLTRYEQETARKRLKEHKVLEEKLSGVPATIHYRVNFDVLAKLLGQLVENHQTRLGKTTKLDSGKPTNYPENTTEITNKEEVTPASQAQPLTPTILSLQDELMTLNGSAPTVSPRTEKKERKPKSTKSTSVSPDDANNYHREMFTALAALCVLDPKVKDVRGQLNSVAKQLLDAGYTVADLEKYKAWWKSQDWRGQRGDAPTLGLIPKQILQATQWVPWTPPPVPAKRNGPSLETLRSDHKQYCYEQWNYSVAAELGISPTLPGAFNEWYTSEAAIPDDQLADWYEQLLIKSKELHQW